MSLFCIHGRLHGKCLKCGPTEEQLRERIGGLYAENADLKARLRQVRRLTALVNDTLWDGPLIDACTDLRVKAWKKWCGLS